MPIHSSACSSFEADPELQPNSDHHYSDNSANSDRWSNTEEALEVSHDRLQLTEIKRQASLARIRASRDMLIKAQNTLLQDNTPRSLVSSSNNRVGWLTFDPRVHDI